MLTHVKNNVSIIHIIISFLFYFDKYLGSYNFHFYLIKIVTGNPTGKIFLGIPRRRWEDNIRKDLN